MLISLLRILKFAFQDLWRNIWLSLITVTIMTLALVSINFLIVFNVVADIASKVIQEKIDVSVYLKPGVGNDQAESIKQYLLTLNEVKSVDLITPDAALEDFKKKHGDNEKIMESISELDENPLGYTLIVLAKESGGYQNIMNSLDAPQYADFIMDKNYEDYKPTIDRIESTSKKVEKTGVVLSFIFILISMLIIMNTVRIAIYTHREEIGIMRLVGATNWFIRAPFLVESIILSIFAVAISTTILYPLLSISQPYIESFFGTANYNLLDYFNSNFLMIFGLELLGMALLNILTSSLAVRKYLKV